jgi:hypothetical protein
MGILDPYKTCLDKSPALEDASTKYTCDAKAFNYDQYDYRFLCWPSSCTNDDTFSDSYGDTCSSWYDDDSSSCGLYDTDDFTAANACCSCGGGSKSGGSTFAGNTCSNDDTFTDSYNTTCSDWYDGHPEDCGLYDDDDFTAATACCACGGGVKAVHYDTSNDQCINDDR